MTIVIERPAHVDVPAPGGSRVEIPVSKDLKRVLEMASLFARPVANRDVRTEPAREAAQR